MNVRIAMQMLAAILVLALAALLAACGARPEPDDEPPELPATPRVELLVEQLRREYADNSLVFVQDRTRSLVLAVGRIDQILPGDAVEFREHETLDLWCWGNPAEIAPLRHGMWVVFRGKVVGLVQDRLLLEECEFREFFWYWEL